MQYIHQVLLLRFQRILNNLDIAFLSKDILKNSGEDFAFWFINYYPQDDTPTQYTWYDHSA